MNRLDELVNLMSIVHNLSKASGQSHELSLAETLKILPWNVIVSLDAQQRLLHIYIAEDCARRKEKD